MKTELTVTLREITADTVRSIIDLSVAEQQKRFVAPNAVSLAQALFSPEAWYRAIYRGDEPVGFVMLYDESLRNPAPDKPQIGVWRLMVDERHQRKGVGRAALRLVIDHVRNRGGFSKLELCYVPAEGSAERFYTSLGFRNTDRLDQGERVMEWELGET